MCIYEGKHEGHMIAGDWRKWTYYWDERKWEEICGNGEVEVELK